MKGSELQKICEQYPDFEFEFSFTDVHSKSSNARSLNKLKLCDVMHSDKVVVLTSDVPLLKEIPYSMWQKQWKTERRIKEELKDPRFLDKYTKKTLREVMLDLFPSDVMLYGADRAFAGMSKARMYRHLQGYAILKDWV